MSLRRFLICGAAGLALSASAAVGDTSPTHDVANVDLAKAFATRSPWRLVATQGPATKDYGDNPAPGALTLCLEKGADGACTPVPVPLRPMDAGGPAWEPHYLNAAKPVYPQGASKPPLLLIVTASLNSGDGDQVIVTQLLRYDRVGDKFTRIFARDTGHNNNQEIRFVESGTLRGDLIIAEPTENAPYGYWVEVDKFTPPGAYKQVLRYRSATRYGDGNSLGVIDSEMPNIEQRLGLWKPGSPLPLPVGTPCPNPHLKQGALWCK